MYLGFLDDMCMVQDLKLLSLAILLLLYCRIRITKAAEFFKAVIPGMEPNMDKATAFHLTVQYMVFLRNALRQQDPTVIPKLHEVCGDAVNQAVQMVLWRFRPIASSPTEAKRVRLFYSGGGRGGELANFQW